MHFALYNDTYDALAGQLSPGARVLEAGCGPGNISAYLLAKNPGLHIHGIDLAPKMIALAKKNVPQATFEVMDCRHISVLGDKYNAVVCGFCIPYLAKEETAKLITDSADLLLPGGILYLSLIEGDYSRSGYAYASNGRDKTFVYYYDETYLRDALASGHFQCQHVFRKEYIQPAGGSAIHLILLARKTEKKAG